MSTKKRETFSKALDGIINEAHYNWQDREEKCRKLGHKQESLMINYCHIQVLHICRECLKEGIVKHNAKFTIIGLGMIGK